MTLRDYQDEIARWYRREINPHRPEPLMVAAKVCEEAGEFVGAVVKSRELYRNDGIDWTSASYKELGDVLIAAIQAATANGWNVEDVLAARWADVSQRRFLTRDFPQDAV